MAQVNAGRVRFISRGEYNNSTQYYLFDLVDYNGSSYFAKANTTGNVPTNTTYWQLVAEKGNTGGDGPVGPTGNGIASIVKTASAGLIDTYTITFTNGTTTTFNVTNGQDGDVTQEYVDEENERLKSVFNVLPKVNGSGESVTLENTGDTMLYKMDLKGNTSQEVIQGEVGLEEEDTSIYVDDVNEDKENYITLKGNTYQDGEPTPDTPQEIEVVTGLNEVKVEGKNLFDKNNADIINAFLNDSGYLQAATNYRSIIFPTNTNTTYAISKIASNMFRVAEYKTLPTIDSNWTNRIRNDNATTIIYTTSSTGNYIVITYKRETDTLTEQEILDSIQIEQNSQATPYEAYKGQTYPINLGSIELCKIGTYQDRIYKSNGNWYLHKEIGKVVLDGSEDWNSWYNVGNNIGFYYNNNSLAVIGVEIALNGALYCNKFSETPLRTDIVYGDVEAIKQCGGTGKQYIALGVNKTRLSDYSTKALAISSLKSWLSSNNVYYYYVLATPTTTEITDATLVNQLNALYNATIYSTTHINTETSNLLPYIDLKYNVVTASPSPERASEVKVVTGNNTITISNEDGTKTQTYNLTLGNLELCKIGDYQDYLFKDNGKWYLHKEIGKIVLNGTQQTASSGTKTTGQNRFNIIVDNVASGQPSDIANIISDRLIAGSRNNTYDCIDRIATANNLIQIYSDLTKSMSANDFKTWLDSNNIVAYYQLATPTTTQITDQLLVSQLDELQKAMSYYDKTLITQTNASKPFILDVVGIRDLQDIFNL